MKKINIAVGNFFFKYRNGLFPVIFFITLIIFRPQGHSEPNILELAMVWAGALLLLSGQAVRLITIGFDYIDRGGKGGNVYATRLVHKGIYALTRNPMYIGNILMVTGFVFYSGSIVITGILLPLFLYIYHAIIIAEENYLRGAFGADYDSYCAATSRYLISIKNMKGAFDGLQFDWKRVLRKDYGTIMVALLGLILLPLFRTVNHDGWETAKRSLPMILIELGIALALYTVARVMKKKGLLAS